MTTAAGLLAWGDGGIREGIRVRYLVTGGAGFVGSHLVERLLEAGGAVRVLDDFSTGKRENLRAVRDRIEEIEGDVRVAATVHQAMHGVDVVFHQAAIASVPRSLEDPETTLAVNLTGTLRVLQAAREAGVRRVVFASSASVYGDAAVSPITEDVMPRPLSPYAISKLAGEQLCGVFTRVFALETVALRYFNVFGPRQDPSSPYSGVIARFQHLLAIGSTPVIYGDGEQSRDFVYVSDVVEANLRAATAPAAAGAVVNVASGCAVSVNTLLATMARLADRSVRPAYQPGRPGDVRRSRADLSLARAELGYEPGVAIADGLRRVMAASLAAPDAGLERRQAPRP
jgi:UDP-glucose 4-epimerase